MYGYPTSKNASPNALFDSSSPYAACKTLDDFKRILRQQIPQWRAARKQYHECHTLLLNYVREVCSQLYTPSMAAFNTDYVYRGVSSMLKSVFCEYRGMTESHVYDTVHEILFPASRDFNGVQLQELVILVYQILDRSTDVQMQAPAAETGRAAVAHMQDSTPVFNREFSALIDSTLAGVSSGRLEAFHHLTAYTSDLSTDDQWAMPEKKGVDTEDAQIQEAIRLSLTDTQFAMEEDGITDAERAQIEDMILLSLESSMMLED
jgi:hypothetical protein